MAAALRHEVSGRLTIGTIFDPEFLRLGGFLRALVETYPRIETALRHGMSGWVLERIKTRDLDVGFYIVDPAPDRFHVVQLKPYLYRVLAPAGWKELVNRPDHPEGGENGWVALAQLSWIWTPPESAHNRLPGSSTPTGSSRLKWQKWTRNRPCSIWSSRAWA